MRAFINFITSAFLILLLSTPVLAERSYWDADFDSLRSTLPHLRSDTARLRTLVQLVHIIDLTELHGRQQAPALLDQLLVLNGHLRRLDDRPYRAMREGVTLWLSDSADAQALAHLKRAVALFDEQKKPAHRLLTDLAPLYNRLHQVDERFRYFQRQLAHYRLHGPYQNEAACYLVLGSSFRHRGDLNQAISYYLRAADLFKRFDRRFYINELIVTGAVYGEWGNPQKSLQYLNQSLRMADDYAVKGYQRLFLLRSLSRVHQQLRNYPEALRFADLALTGARKDSVQRELFTAYSLEQKAAVLVPLNRLAEAGRLLQRAQQLADSLQLPMSGRPGLLALDATWSQYYAAKGDLRQAERHLLLAYHKATTSKLNALRPQLLVELIRFYDARRQPVSVQQYTRAYLNLTDSLKQAQSPYLTAHYEGERVERAQLARIDSLRQTQALQTLRLHQRNRLLAGALLAVAVMAGLAGVVYWQLRENKRMLRRLRQTQNELVAAEKWAFVGEVSAGIAHELQNPLNFMKRFAEVSTRMIDSMNRAAGDKTREAALEQEILLGLKQNLQEISQHGLRASSIIKDMLEHSRSGTAQRELTDLNQLLNQQLRLAYEAFQAQHPAVPVTLERQFDLSLAPANVIPTDLGRVLLNLLTNALHAIYQRQQSGEEGYVPLLRLSTQQLPQAVQVQIWDNGTGMSKAVMNRVFEPFFTTKPVGDGSGLGLSISHDIVTKSHGGTLSVESQEGQWTCFTVLLPAS